MASSTLRSRLFTSIEPLEDRIAPALLVNGANLLGGSGPATGETSVGDHSALLVKVLAGRAIVWYNGFEITGISVGPGASLEIHGDIHGDIVGNLTASGQLSDSDNDPTNGRDGDLLLPNSIAGIKILPSSSEAGNVDHIITGGSISNVKISGAIEGIYAGDGVFRAESAIGNTGTVISTLTQPIPGTEPPVYVTIDTNPVTPGVQPSFSFSKNAGGFIAGASIQNVSVTNAEALEMYAGNGGPAGAQAPGKGFAGGSIVGVTIENAFVPAGAPLNTPSYHLIAGDGENGKSGGAGGSIASIIEKSSFGPVVITGGLGGTGLGGAGGHGGNVGNLDLQSASSRYTVTAGDGGDGTPGGAGGNSTNNNFSNRTPVAGVILSADFTGDGLDDVLVADAGSGQMVLSAQDSNGNFAPVTQFLQGSTDVITIDAAGSTPNGAVAVDINHDGKLDVVVSYKNSSSLGIFLNQGGGSFYDTTADAYAITKVALGFTPQKVSALDGNGFLLAISENNGGSGMLHLAQSETNSSGDTSYLLDTRINTFGTTIADVVPGFVAFTNGTISSFTINDLQAKNPFATTDLGVAVHGGLDSLDLDQSGTRLLALSTAGHSITVIDLTVNPITLPPITIDLKTVPGLPLVAHFTHDLDPNTQDDIVVLTAPTTGSEIAVFNYVAPDADPTTVDPGYTLGTTFKSSALLKNFVPVYGAPQVGIAALASSLSQFTYIKGFLSAQDFALPFASKSVSVTSGHGGDGLDFGLVLGKGGAGGSLLGVNADAQDITLLAGDGGDSQHGVAGAGGNILNPTTFTTTSGLAVAPALLAEASLEVTAGHGGTPVSSAAKTAAGGAGGSVGGISATLTAGFISLTGGDGGDGNGGAGGAGGSVNGATTIDQDGDLFVTAGTGGDAPSGLAASGAGGNITNITHTLTLDPDIESLEKAYSVVLLAGNAGTSAGGQGGAGGSLSNISLTLDGADRTYDDKKATPPLVDAHRDSTVHVTATAGIGGSGARGGAGGSITDFSSESVFDQFTKDNEIVINYVVMNLTAGQGGVGSAGNGGAGGNIKLGHPISGVTAWDPDSFNNATGTAYDISVPALVVTAGQGGDGSVKGGVGGSVAGLVAQNSADSKGENIVTTLLTSAVVTAGNGGHGGSSDGGLGGSITKALVGVNDGYLSVTAGTGGDSTNAKGGAGGAVSSSEFGLASSIFTVGLGIVAGDGGVGHTAGGAGGAISKLTFNIPESTSGFSALIYAGNGGAATSGAAVGGRGGDVNGILEAKDVNSSINSIQAGNGGDNLQGRGGAGGNVLNVNTVGFIGRPSDNQMNQLGVFDTIGSLTIAQGVFSGRGGIGTTDGVNGSVQNIIAQQIAAIAAAPDLATGLFAVASRVANVKTDLIGFDANGNNAFDDSLGGSASPTSVEAVDGFILASAIASVTGQRAGFVFNS